LALPPFETRQLIWTLAPDCQVDGMAVMTGARFARGAGAMAICPPLAPELLPSAEPSSTRSVASATTIAKRGVASSGSWIVSESLHEAFEATMPPWRRVPTSASSALRIVSVDR
jgi:hypothetical protein